MAEAANEGYWVSLWNLNHSAAFSVNTKKRSFKKITDKYEEGNWQDHRAERLYATITDLDTEGSVQEGWYFFRGTPSEIVKQMDNQYPEAYILVDEIFDYLDKPEIKPDTVVTFALVDMYEVEDETDERLHQVLRALMKGVLTSINGGEHVEIIEWNDEYEHEGDLQNWHQRHYGF